jgi:hypothetical protein
VRSVDEARVVALAVTQVGDGLFNLVRNDWIDEDLERLRLPNEARFLFGSIKLASAGGLLVGLRRPALGRLTARLLVAYFVLALLAHVRVGDRGWRYLPAAAMLVWSARATRAYQPGR